MAWISASAVVAATLALASPVTLATDATAPTMSGINVSLRAGQTSPAVSVATDAATGSAAAPQSAAEKASTGPDPVRYTVEVTSSLPEPVEISMAQEFAEPVGTLTGSDPAAGIDPATTTPTSVAADQGKLVWRFQLPPNETVSLDSAAVLAVGQAAPVSTVCASNAVTGRVLDCANDAPTGGGGGIRWPAWVTALGWWWLVLLGGLGLLGYLATKVPWPRVGHALQVRSAESRYGLLPALLAGVLLVGVTLAGLAILGPTLRRTAAAETSHGSGWYGERSALTLGQTTSDEVVEFTVFQWSCGKDATDQWCRATVGARNISDADQSWFAAMQRLYLDDKVWASPDGPSNLAVNGGEDVFGKLPVGTDLTAVLVFKIGLDVEPQRLELRENRFARGVYLDLTK